jgi:hypothetical protein
MFASVYDMATAKKKTTAKKATAKKAPAKKAAKKKAPAKKAAVKKTKSTFAKAEDVVAAIAAEQAAAHADKIEQLIDSIPAQVSVDARGLKMWLRKLFSRLSK